MGLGGLINKSKAYIDKITKENVFAFIEGNVKLYLDRWDNLPIYYREQVAYRMELCKFDCVLEGKCKYCNCKVPGKLYVSKSCNNGERFPNILEEKDWEEYKKIKKIRIDFK